jgi:hypothetical protein
MALKEFFGYRAGDTMKEFKAEIDRLSPAEREALTKLAEKAPEEREQTA